MKRICKVCNKDTIVGIESDHDNYICYDCERTMKDTAHKIPGKKTRRKAKRKAQKSGNSKGAKIKN